MGKTLTCMVDDEFKEMMSGCGPTGGHPTQRSLLMNATRKTKARTRGVSQMNVLNEGVVHQIIITTRLKSQRHTAAENLLGRMCGLHMLAPVEGISSSLMATVKAAGTRMYRQS